MRRPNVEPLPQHLYPVDEWRLVEARYSDRYYKRMETAFALSNGYVGLRGTYDEARPVVSPGTFINGFHETWPITYGEDAFGLARTGQTILAVPDASIVQLFIDDEPLYLPAARTRTYERALDLRTGVLTRDLIWSTPAGKHVQVSSRRLVSLEDRHLMAITFDVTMLDRPAAVTICSRLLTARQADLINSARTNDPRAAHIPTQALLLTTHHVDGVQLAAGFTTANSGMRLGVGVDHALDTACPHECTASLDGGQGEFVVTVDAQAAVPVRLTKYVSYHSSHHASVSDLLARCERTLARAQRAGFDSLVHTQQMHLDHFWDRADVDVTISDKPERAQQAIRWNLFQVAQATWRAEGAGLPAKGLTGQGYDGHYFWDAETFVLPFLAYTQPRIARNLLRFRHTMLNAAREHARELHQRGALFPWRTINGKEASANYQASTAQYHINADIAYALVRYMAVRGDVGFAAEVAGEMLVELARFWEDLGFFGSDGAFHIHGVTGPDEYTTVVNDNTYTNLMARRTLRNAARVIRDMQENQSGAYAALVADVGLTAEEPLAWERAADHMYVPYDDARQMHPQDDSFLTREVWDLDATPNENFPLLLHYHPLVIYRYQVLKQADVVLAMVLLGDEFSREQKLRNFDYYDPLTTGDSSLSACMQSILAAEVGREDQAVAYFQHALLMDLADVAGNSSDGVHIASAAGVWLCLAYGFGGVRDFGGCLSVNPNLPRGWVGLRFSLRFQGRQIRIRLTHEEERYILEEGDPLKVDIRGRSYVLQRGEPLLMSGVSACSSS